MLSLATLCASAFGQNANPARPGTLNYVEGQASIEGRPLTPHSIGTTELEASQYLATAKGKAEILLTPGVFLRIAEDSTVQMVSPDLMHTEIRLEQGRADVEVDQLFPQNRLLVDMKNGQTHLLKNGLYTFDSGTSTVRVFDGKAAVYPGTNLQTDIKPIDVKDGRQLALNGEPAKPQKFDKEKSQDDLLQWSSLRSEYLGEANLSLATEYEGAADFNPGWYWAGGPYGYSWLPGDGLFWNPFGYGFYSPGYLYGGGFIYGGYGYGRGGFYNRGGIRGTGIYRAGTNPGARPGGNGNVAHASGFAGGGGFHGGGGGGHR
ncbi:FecR domain-containing protein [Granulicella sibirica]|uniref:FecR protein domain-containing protein n=1 Tax=Granulicella sibirica TaxID=2479048 RepID=A0A4V1L623_9BACT|nr:FecR domain-containing protein [Granulicella sibirica]RXH57764.1 hypothetical protein GRAN_1074 [Granulicella sibirica]